MLKKEGDKTEGSGNKVVKKEKIEKTIFDDFEGLEDKKESKPVAIFVYVPEKNGKATKASANCQKLIEVMEHPDVKPSFSKLTCYKISIDALDKERRKRYKISSAPALIFFDATGKRVKKITSPRIKPVVLKALINKIVEISGKRLKKLQKERDKT
ncbi:MAG: hypothetical protein ACYS8W_19980 [Planctomycetota bacterium]